MTLFFCVPAAPGGTSRMWRAHASLDRVAELAAGLDPSAVPRSPTWEPHTEPVVLVCTNGRHDQCCATKGRPVIAALRESHLASHAWESSHIGGDRFAANVAVLPDSLYFGRCQPETVVEMVDAVLCGNLDLAHFRGRTTYSLAQQAAEHFVRDLTGAIDAHEVIVERPTPARAADAEFIVPVNVRGRGQFEVRLAIHHTASPDRLTCRGPAGARATAFELVSIAQLPEPAASAD